MPKRKLLYSVPKIFKILIFSEGFPHFSSFLDIRIGLDYALFRIGNLIRMKRKNCFSFSELWRRTGQSCPVFTLVIFLVIAYSGASSASAAVKVPKWLLDEINRPLPAYPPETEAVVLLAEQATVVSPKGTLITTCRWATKVLKPGGAETARQLVRVDTYDIKVRSMTGWVINPSAKPQQATMKQVISSSLAPDTLYTDAKSLLLILPKVGAGSIVGFEWKEKRTPPSLEDSFVFQGSFPVLRALYSLSLPQRWTAEFHGLNWSPLEPQQNPDNSQITSFEVSNIPAVADEPFMPNEHTLVGRLLVRLKPPDTDARSFSGWLDMGAWYEGLSKERRIPDEAVSRKAAALTAGASGSLDKIYALSEFVQKEIRYVSIQIGIGGFQPHYASSVLANRYGDCKDKATLLSAMLQAIGIESYPILVHTDRGFVT